MQPHVDPASMANYEVAHQVHVRPEHCEVAGCLFEHQSPAVQAASVKAASDWMGRYGGPDVASRAADVRAKKQSAIVDGYIRKPTIKREPGQLLSKGQFGGQS